MAASARTPDVRSVGVLGRSAGPRRAAVLRTGARGDLASGGQVVYSRTLEAARTGRTRIEREFDPEAVRRLKSQSDSEVTVGGPDLAAQAIGAGLVDEYQMFVVPVVVGAGKQALPHDGRIELELLDERRFQNGTVFLHYRVRTR